MRGPFRLLSISLQHRPRGAGPGSVGIRRAFPARVRLLTFGASRVGLCEVLSGSSLRLLLQIPRRLDWPDPRLRQMRMARSP